MSTNCRQCHWPRGVDEPTKEVKCSISPIPAQPRGEDPVCRVRVTFHQAVMPVRVSSARPSRLIRSTSRLSIWLVVSMIGKPLAVLVVSVVERYSHMLLTTRRDRSTCSCQHSCKREKPQSINSKLAEIRGVKRSSQRGILRLWASLAIST